MARPGSGKAGVGVAANGGGGMLGAGADGAGGAGGDGSDNESLGSTDGEDVVEEEDDGGVCAICMDNPVAVLAMGCHHGLCVQCAFQLTVKGRDLPACPFSAGRSSACVC